MRQGPWLLLLAGPVLAQAAVLNYEFKFTPYTGDLKQEQVHTVAGTAMLYLNNVPFTDTPVQADDVPVLFDDREIAPSVWLPTASLGPRLRKGLNHFRIEFTPQDPALKYRAQLSWAAVNDQSSESSAAPGQLSATNQSGEGKLEKDAQGKLVLERDFSVDFPADLPWHHYPAVTALSDDDRARLLAVLKARADGFKPPFEPVYAALAEVPEVDVKGVRKLRCLDKAYAAGVRVGPPTAEQLEFLTTGQPEVVVQAKGQAHSLYAIDDELLRQKIKNQDQQFCVGTALSVVYGPRLAAVRDPNGGWKVVY
jgi:hypothetical protein